MCTGTRNRNPEPRSQSQKLKQLAVVEALARGGIDAVLRFYLLTQAQEWPLSSA